MSDKIYELDRRFQAVTGVRVARLRTEIERFTLPAVKEYSGWGNKHPCMCGRYGYGLIDGQPFCFEHWIGAKEAQAAAAQDN